MTTMLDQLRTFSEVVADTGDIDAIAKYKPLDATTNPSLLLKAAALESYAPLIKDSLGTPAIPRRQRRQRCSVGRRGARCKSWL